MINVVCILENERLYNRLKTNSKINCDFKTNVIDRKDVEINLQKYEPDLVILDKDDTFYEYALGMCKMYQLDYEHHDGNYKRLVDTINIIANRKEQSKLKAVEDDKPGLDFKKEGEKFKSVESLDDITEGLSKIKKEKPAEEINTSKDFKKVNSLFENRIFDDEYSSPIVSNLAQTQFVGIISPYRKQGSSFLGQLLSQLISETTQTKVCMLEVGKSKSLYDHFDILQRVHSKKLKFNSLFNNDKLNENLVRINSVYYGIKHIDDENHYLTSEQFMSLYGELRDAQVVFLDFGYISFPEKQDLYTEQHHQLIKMIKKLDHVFLILDCDKESILGSASLINSLNDVGNIKTILNKTASGINEKLLRYYYKSDKRYKSLIRIPHIDRQHILKSQYDGKNYFLNEEIKTLTIESLIKLSKFILGSNFIKDFENQSNDEKKGLLNNLLRKVKK